MSLSIDDGSGGSNLRPVMELRQAGVGFCGSVIAFHSPLMEVRETDGGVGIARLVAATVQ